jgi:dienelactone hydrolase
MMLVVGAQPDRLTRWTRGLVQPPPRPPTNLPRERSGQRSTADARPAADHVSRRQRLVAVSLLLLAAGAVAASVLLASAGPPRHQNPGTTPSRATRTPTPTTAKPSSFAVGLRVVRLVDSSRTITLADGSSEPRSLLTYVRYPALGAPGAADLPGAPAARASGPFPLVVFGHGFNVTPALYARLLHRWAQAGYVVASPVFPLENPSAPGGPNEADLTNQPADIRFVISSMLASSRLSSDPLAGLIDPGAIGVSGQSDGGDTALAVAYDPRSRDPRVGAAVILSGAEIPAAGEFAFPAGGPPLLAAQGTADTVNPPSLTDAFFEVARRPKYLLRLLGAEHLPPYSDEQPQLAIVERVTLAFFDGYLKRQLPALRRLVSLGTVPGTATLLAEP